MFKNYKYFPAYVQQYLSSLIIINYIIIPFQLKVNVKCQSILLKNARVFKLTMHNFYSKIIFHIKNNYMYIYRTTEFFMFGLNKFKSIFFFGGCISFQSLVLVLSKLCYY